ncbi:MAG: hypothetical protein AAB623_00900 [Patescibacteria group bacterium]
MLFLVVLFLFKKTSIFQNTETFKQETAPNNGLTVDNTDLTIEDLVDKDTDGDGIPDWQESLYGLDPTKKETTPGTPDSSALSKLRTTQENTGKTTIQGGGNASATNTETLTQTEKFSRELFAIVVASSQNGAMDQATIDALSASLAEKMQNPNPRKIYTISDIKIINDDNFKAFMNYINASDSIHKKSPTIKYTAFDVLQEFSKDENNPDTSVLVKLDPIITQTNAIKDAMIKTNVPKSLSTLHLNVINSLERLSENLNDIKLFDTDPVVSLGGISQYSQNTNTLLSDIANLQNIIQQKLNN